MTTALALKLNGIAMYAKTLPSFTKNKKNVFVSRYLYPVGGQP